MPMAVETIRTTCTMDCPDSCALEVTVKDGMIAQIRGSHDHPTTNGFICDKVARFDRRVYHRDRLLTPLVRNGAKGSGEFRPVSWAEALDLVGSRLAGIRARWGGEAILPYHYGGSNGLLGDGFLDNYFFARLGASRLARTLCAAPASEVATGMYGKMAGVAYEDYPAARCIIVWGANPKASNIHLMPFLRKAKKNGAFIASVDPILNFTGQEIDLHLPIYPGTDLPVALAMIRIWREEGRLDRAFLAEHASDVETLLAAAEPWTIERAAEEARIDGELIRKLAHSFAEANPALIRCGWGTERNLNGGQALAAVLAMPALLGKFGVRGGGYTLSNSGAAKLDINKLFGPLEWNTRIINMTQLGEVLNRPLDPPVKALFVYNCNPVATVPDQTEVIKGLSRDDLFTVVHEQVVTDTVPYADVVLPAVTFLEQYEIKRGYGSYIMGGVQPVIEACGEAKPNEWLFAELGRAMGFSDEPFTWDTATCMRKVAEALSLNGKPASGEPLMSGRIHRYDFDGPTPVQFRTVQPATADGKAHLAPAALGLEPYLYQRVQNGPYPLALISPSNNKMITSTLGEFNYPELFLAIHPGDAAARGISDGDPVRVFNHLGEVRCRASLSDRIRQGVAALPKGAWRKSSANGLTSTALCPAHVNVVAGGACYNDARVEVEKVS